MVNVSGPMRLLVAITAMGLSLGTTAFADLAASPMLTPLAARDVSDACPGTDASAAALVRGATLDEALIARKAFAPCASQTRLPGYEWKTESAKLALAGADLTIGLATNDSGALQRAIDETNDLRSLSLATDEQVRSWRVIPDFFDNLTKRPESYGYVAAAPGDSLKGRRPFVRDQIIVTSAAYVNVAARTGQAWIHTVAQS